jgi:pyrroloquinoline quinone biosynthesis protein B
VNSPGAEGAVVAYRLTDSQTGATSVYAPGLSAWDGGIEGELRAADCVLVDGTFWSDDEMARTGTGARTGREMGHLAMSGPDGSAERLGGLPARHLIYTHINNTNPVWDESSPQRRELADKGIRIGRAGLRLEL